MNYQLHPVINQHLQNIGLTSGDAIETYLFPSLAGLPSPDLFKSMNDAVDLVLRAMLNEHDILVWGDYDVDGITGAALLVLFFRKIGYEVKHHIPDRLTEGYGLNQNRLIDIAASMSQEKLLITVDCGISNSTEIEVARELGFTIIVTDHHQVPTEKLNADATINPKQSGCQFPFKDLAGVGVSFYLAAGIRSSLDTIKDRISVNCNVNMKSFMGMVALGTLGDVMPLSGVNRILAKAGFEVIAQNNDFAIGELLRGLDIDPVHLNSEQIAFQVAPVINASGRMGRPDLPFSMLTNSSPEQADTLVKNMMRLNDDRKKICRSDLEKAQSLISSTEVEQDRCIVICNDFHDGVLGITASRLADLYNVATLVCCPNPSDSSVIKGSGRAPTGVDLYECLAACKDSLISFGGHEAAAGFSLLRDQFGGLQRNFKISIGREYLNNNNDTDDIEMNILKLPLSEALDPLLIRNLVQLEPFGEANPRPLFIDSDVSFISLTLFGRNNEHARGVARGKYRNVPFIGFNLGKRFAGLDRQRTCSMTFTHMLDTYKGKLSWKIRADNVWQ
jgi:single-stranded-DNA-specific exonuclease